MKKTTSPSEQSEAFIKAARELGCDEDEAAFDEKLKRVAGHKSPDPGTARAPTKSDRTKPAK